MSTERQQLESDLRELWQQLLGTSGVGLDDNFVGLGGTSILAAEMVAYARRTYALDVSVRDVLAGMTISEMANRPKRVTPVETIGSAEEGSLWLPSPLQEVMLERGWPSFVAFLCKVSGRIDPTRMRAALDEVVARHESLRLAFVDTDEGWRMKLEPPQKKQIPFRVEQFGDDWTDEDLMSEARLAFRGFRKERDSLADVVHYDGGPERSALFFVFEHLVFDGEAIAIFLRELGRCYSGVPADPNEPLVSFVRRAQAQRTAVQNHPETLEYWRAVMAEIGPYCRVDLPGLQERKPDEVPAAARAERALDPKVLVALHARCRAAAATPLIGYLSTLSMALHDKVGRPQRLAVNTANSGRSQPGSENTIGLFADEMTLDLGVSGGSFDAMLPQVRQRVLDAMDHDLVSRRDLVALLCPDAQIIRRSTPYLWFGHPHGYEQVVVSLGTDATVSHTKLVEDLAVRGRPYPGLNLEVEQNAGEVPQLLCEYAPDEYPPSEAEDLLDKWATAMSQAADG